MRGAAFVEAIVRPMAWEAFPAGARPRFEAFRTPGVGERWVIEPCGPAGHLAPENQPAAIATAIAGWLDRHRLGATDTPQR